MTLHRHSPFVPPVLALVSALMISLAPFSAAPAQAREGGNGPPDPEELRAAAEEGDVEAMFHLGLLHQAGLGVEKDAEEALEWFRRAADAGHLGALYEVGRAHLFGKGTDVDTDAGLAEYRQAAEGGHRIAMESLGHLHLFGEHGIEAAPAEGVEWLERAYEAGSASAARTLGAAYAEGKGVERDRALAETWYRRAAERGDEEAEEWLEEHGQP